MKVVLIAGGRGLRPQWINQTLHELGVSDGQVELTLVTWYPPAGPLPVGEHWVAGPWTHGPMGRRDLSTSPVEPVNDAKSAQTSSAGADERGRAAVPASSMPRNPAAPVLPPIYTPARLRKAAAWRLRRIRREVRMFYRGARSRGTLPGRLIYRLRHLRPVQRLRANTVTAEFAVAISCNARIRDAVRDAKVVVGVDGNSHRAAWLLARRVPGPEVVIGLPAARRIVQAAYGSRRPSARPASKEGTSSQADLRPS